MLALVFCLGIIAWENGKAEIGGKAGVRARERIGVLC